MPCRDLRYSLVLTSLTYRLQIDKGHQEAPTEKTHRRPRNLLRKSPKFINYINDRICGLNKYDLLKHETILWLFSKGISAQCVDYKLIIRESYFYFHHYFQIILSYDSKDKYIWVILKVFFKNVLEGAIFSLDSRVKTCIFVWHFISISFSKNLRILHGIKEKMLLTLMKFHLTLGSRKSYKFWYQK